MKNNLLRWLAALATTLCAAWLFADQARAVTNGASHLDRTIGREPRYQSTPKYCLMTLGTVGAVPVWMVEDGRRLFVDRNANRDLTDDGPPLESGNVRDIGGNRWDFQYRLPAITPTNGSRHTSLVLRRWNYGDKEDSYGLSLSIGDNLPMYAGWFGTFWSTNRAQAPVIHFGGPFTPQLLRRKAFILGEKEQRLSLGFFNPGSGAGAESRLSIDALPRVVVPKLTIEWPTAAGAAPVKTSHELTQRCCYWEFYQTNFELPRGVVTGNAKVSVELVVGALPIELTTKKMVVPVVAQEPEPDSPR